MQAAPPSYWQPTQRLAAFLLSGSSIGCLLSEFYGLCSMRIAALWIMLPALAALTGWSFWDFRRGCAAVARPVALGAAAGLIAAVAYDLFRLPFVYAAPLGIDAFVPAMNLFKVFPRFGAMLLGQPLEQPTYSAAAHFWGWIYHFSNGATFGVMYLALIGDPRRRSWFWAVAWAVVLELGMLLTPYPAVFAITVTGTFIAVTLAAHAVFGAILGRVARRVALGSRRYELR